MKAGSPSTALARALDNRNLLGLLFMLPAAALLLLFLTYPLGLGTYLGFTDTKVGRGGTWVGRKITSSCGEMKSRAWRCSTRFSTRPSPA